MEVTLLRKEVKVNSLEDPTCWLTATLKLDQEALEEAGGSGGAETACWNNSIRRSGMLYVARRSAQN